jgi:CBS-domain-containing membrane protein
MKRVRDVMTRRVVVVQDSAPFKEIVALMRQRGVSAVPVLDRDEHLMGIVSEADLMLKEEHAVPDDSQRVFKSRRRRVERTKAEGVVARELMSRSVVTIDEEAPIARAARVMHEHGVKRLPVVDANGAVLGIVSRTDLLRVFLRPDQDIAHEIEDALMGPTRWAEPEQIRVTVRDGVVTLEGGVERRSQIPVLASIARAVDGVVDIEARLGYEVDDVTPGLEVLTPWGIYLPPTPRR